MLLSVDKCLVWGWLAGWRHCCYRHGCRVRCHRFWSFLHKESNRKWYNNSGRCKLALLFHVLFCLPFFVFAHFTMTTTTVGFLWLRRFYESAKCTYRFYIMPFLSITVRVSAQEVFFSSMLPLLRLRLLHHCRLDHFVVDCFTLLEVNNHGSSVDAIKVKSRTKKIYN